MKKPITSKIDAFELRPDITEKEIIDLLLEIVTVAYKNTKTVGKYSKIMVCVVLNIICMVCLGCIYHKEYFFLICLIVIAMSIIYIWKESEKVNNLQKLSCLFIDNKGLKINLYTYNNVDNEFYINYEDKINQPINEAQVAFLILDYILLVFKNNDISIVNPSKNDKEKILYELYHGNSRIISYDKTVENIFWMKYYYKKIFVKISIAIIVVFLFYSFMILTK